MNSELQVFLQISFYSSLAIHPNKLIIATGQCGGHDKKTASVISAENIIFK
jgi:hypothetical protein